MAEAPYLLKVKVYGASQYEDLNAAINQADSNQDTLDRAPSQMSWDELELLLLLYPGDKARGQRQTNRPAIARRRRHYCP